MTQREPSRGPFCSWLDDLSVCQIAHEWQIGFEKVEGGKLKPLCPSHFTEDAVFNFALISQNREKSEFHGAATFVFVSKASDFVANGRDNPKLFLNLTTQRIPPLFTFFDLAAGELPLQRHRLMARALANKKHVVFDNEGRDDVL